MCSNDSVGPTFFDLSAQQAHEGIDRVYFHFAAVAPNRLNNRATRNDASLVANEEFQKSKLSERKLDLFAAPKSSKRIGFEQQIAILKDVARFGRGATRQSADSCEQLLKGEWFGEIVIGA